MIPPWVADYIGLPFMDFGRTRDGVDCWGLVRLVLDEQFKIIVPSYAEYYQSALNRGSVGNHIETVIHDPLWSEIPNGQERRGDIIVTRVHNLPCHVGIVVDRNVMLHVHPDINSCIEDYNRPKWRNLIRGFYRPT